MIDPERCPTCGSAVRVETSSEGTSHYVPDRCSCSHTGIDPKCSRHGDVARANADRQREVARKRKAPDLPGWRA